MTHVPEAHKRVKEALDEDEQELVRFIADRARPNLLDWWVKMAKTVDKELVLVPVLPAAFKKGNVPVLEWCKSHPEVVDAYNNGKPKEEMDDWALEFAVKGKLLDWIDSLGIATFRVEHWPASQAGCVAGDTRALQWLLNKRCLVGSQRQLLAAAAEANDLEVLEWIIEHVDSSSPAATSWPAVQDDPFIGACIHSDVKIFDWLFAHGFQLDVGKPGKYLEFAGGNQVQVLEWLVSHLTVTNQQLKSAFSAAFRKARSAHVLNWWKHQLEARGMSARGTVADTWYYQDHCNVELWDWWLNKAGPMTTFLPELGGPCPSVCRSVPAQCTPTACVAILQLWHDAGLDLNPVACITAASTVGNLGALDWFLGKVSLDVFVKTFSLRECIVGLVPGCTYSAKTLLWWWANVPQLRGWTGGHVNCGTIEDPISAHIVAAMLKLPGVSMPDLKTLSQRGNVAMLKYIKDCRKDLMDTVNVNNVLVAASQGISVRALDWWMTQSGLHISACPQSFVAGEVALEENIRAWWLQSGLCPDGIAEYMGMSEDEEDEDGWW
ncbi:hypothetical protein BCR44DRAFT_195476 [Catenaria anguillulae PL171]|uniref:Ankyrin repeat-containing domain protein n=1 Tax=Catenaria anguillulae PL171 TaxID=765915 RepID=A0A1Y2HMD8_9FUNG|nr:hypothetical protein BCR44DRAFT_195476 [Catenaria anguillulae PL171]